MTYAILIAANVTAWVWAFAAFADRPALMATAFLAYTFGLRHAFDADHIAAIDNVVRKLMQDGKTPYSVGFFFSLGHSTIVVLASVAIAATAAALQSRLEDFHGMRRDRYGRVGAVPVGDWHRQSFHPEGDLGSLLTRQAWREDLG